MGGGGFSFPRYLRAIDPASRHVVLELDPVVLATAREELGFTPDDAIEVVLGDARRTILGVPTDSRRLVVGDAFGGRSVPWHLTTTEFVREIDRVLTPDGRYVQNLIDGPALRFVRAETATLRQVFEHVAVITWNATFDGSGGGNVVLVASHEPFDAAAIDEAVRSDDGRRARARRRRGARCVHRRRPDPHRRLRPRGPAHRRLTPAALTHDCGITRNGATGLGRSPESPPSPEDARGGRSSSVATGPPAPTIDADAGPRGTSVPPRTGGCAMRTPNLLVTALALAAVPLLTACGEHHLVVAGHGQPA